MVLNIDRGAVLASQVRICADFRKRLKGLLGSPRLAPGEACWIVPCNCIHTFGMKYEIGAVFLDRRKKIVGVRTKIKPNRVSKIYFKAHSVLELTPEAAAHCRVGDRLDMAAAR